MKTRVSGLIGAENTVTRRKTHVRFAVSFVDRLRDNACPRGGFLDMNTKDFLKAFRLSPEERRQRDEAIERDAALARESGRPLVAEINSAGLEIESVWDLVNFHTDHAALAPTLIAHLSRDDHPKIKMAIARALITARVRSEACSKALIAELDGALSKAGGQWEGVQQSLAHALAKLAHPSVAAEIEALYGKYKQTFLGHDLAEALKRATRTK